MISHIHKPAEEQKKAEGVYDYEVDYNSQWLFGHGLSYTTFAYSNLVLNKASIGKAEELEVSITLTNTGQREGREVVHLYTSDLHASDVTPDVKRLRRFDKVLLKPGESKTLSFPLEPDDLSYFNREGKKVLEAGEFEVQIGDRIKKFMLLE